jgi:hypothetical protein
MKDETDIKQLCANPADVDAERKYFVGIVIIIHLIQYVISAKAFGKKKRVQAVMTKEEFKITYNIVAIVFLIMDVVLFVVFYKQINL